MATRPTKRSEYNEAETDRIEHFEYNSWYSRRTNLDGETKYTYRKADEAVTATVEPISTEEPEYIYEGSPADYKAPIIASDGFAYNSTLNATVSYRPPIAPLSGYTGNATHAEAQQHNSRALRALFISEDGFAYGSAPTATLPPAPAPAPAPAPTLAKQARPVIYVVRGAPGHDKPLDKSFRVRESSFFRIGCVFDTLRNDTALSAENGPQDSCSEEEPVLDNSRHGQKVYHKIRRFTVIQPKAGHMICLLVSTYGGRGYERPGIHLKEHGFIYVNEGNLQVVKGMNLVPIKVKLSKKSLKFSDPSLINYTKLYIVECNVRVRDCGMLDSESLELLEKNFNYANGPKNQQKKQSWGSYAANVGGLILAGVAGGVVQGYVGGGGPDKRPSNDDLDRGPRRGGTTDESHDIIRVVNTTEAAYLTYPPSDPGVSGNYSPTERYPSSQGYSRSSQQASENLDTAYPSSLTNYSSPLHRPSTNIHHGYSDHDNVDPSVISSYTPSARQITGSPSTYASARHNVRRYSEQVAQAELGYANATATSVDFSSPTQITFEAISTQASTSYTQMILIYKKVLASEVHNPKVYMAGNVKLDSGNEGYNLVASSVVKFLELEPTDDTATVTTYNGEESEIGGEVKITFSGAFREDGDQRYYVEKFRVVDMIHGGLDMLLNERFMKRYCGPPGTLYMRAAVSKKLSKEDKAKKKAQQDKRKQKADEAAAVLAAQREADRDAEGKKKTQKEVAPAGPLTAQGNSDQELEDTSMKQEESETASLLAALELSNETNDGSKGKQKEVAATDVDESTGGIETMGIEESKMG